jgi:serine phosphatase RsbU (regulator of sigma subunit)
VVGKVVTLLGDGVRDGAAARAANDYLFAQRDGRVTCALDIVSVDLFSKTLVITRNSEVPMVLLRDGRIEAIWTSGGRIGTLPQTRPAVMQYPAEPGLIAVLLTDGVVTAGVPIGSMRDPADLLGELNAEGMSATELADAILKRAMLADSGRPHDDMTVVVVRLGPRIAEHPVRRLAVSVPMQR